MKYRIILTLLMGLIPGIASAQSVPPHFAWIGPNSGGNNFPTFRALTNADLASPTVVVNAVSCTLGSTCTISAAATSQTVGTTTIVGGTSLGVMFNNGGVLGNTNSITGAVLVTDGSANPFFSVTLPSGLTIGSTTFAGTNVFSAGNTFNGLVNFTSTFDIGGTTQTFPGSGLLVGTTDTQTLTNKSIDGSEINSGTVSATYLPTATGAAKGVVQGDASTLTITAGTISCTAASSTQLGCVEPDNVTTQISAGKLVAVGAVAASISASGSTTVSGGTNGFVLVQTAGAVAEKAGVAGAFVGTTDTQVLTNKSIDGSEINSGTVPGTYMANVALNSVNSNGGVTGNLGGGNYGGGYLNKFRNGSMGVWQRGITALPTSTAVRGVYTADGWRVSQTGAAFTCAQDAGFQIELYSLKCVGGTSNTDTLFIQPIESYDAIAFAANTVTVQFKYKQTSGVTVVPIVSTCYASTLDVFTTCNTDLAATSLTSCVTNTWCTESYTFTAGAGAANGYQVTFDCNTALTSAQSCWITSADIRVTPGVSLGINNAPPPPEFPPITLETLRNQRYYLVTAYNNYGYASAGGALVDDRTLPTTMRAVGTIGISNQANSNCSFSSLSLQDRIPTGPNIYNSFAMVGIVTATGSGQCAGLARISAEQ